MIRLILDSCVLFFMLPMTMAFGSVLVSIEGVLLEVEMNCVMKCPGKYINFDVGPHLVLLPDSLIDVSGIFPSLFWITASTKWVSLVGKHVRVDGFAENFLGHESLLTAQCITECIQLSPAVPQVAFELDEQGLISLEEQIPLMAEVTLKRAGWRALLSGFTVVQRKGDALIEVHPDGTEVYIKALPPKVPMRLKDNLLIIKGAQ